MNDKLVQRVFSQRTSGKYNEETKMWLVECTVAEEDSEDGVSWRVESITFTGVAPTFDEAHKEAIAQTMNYLGEFVYAKGFDSLIEAVRSAGKNGGKPEEAVSDSHS